MQSDVPHHASAVGVFDVKQHLSSLLERVENGESIVITRHGDPIARLVPFTPTGDNETVKEAIAELKKLRRGVRLPEGVTLRQMIEDGRA